VNRLVEGWTYFVERRPVSQASPEDVVELELFLDAAGAYPAVLESGRPPGTAQEAPVRWRGRLELSRRTSCSWGLAFVLTLCLVALVVIAVLTLIAGGVDALTDHIGDYQKGVTDTTDWFVGAMRHWLSDDALQVIEKKAAEFAQSVLPDLAASLVSKLEDIAGQTFLFFLYLFFWLFEPLPISADVARLIKSYLFLKTCVCVLFAALLSLVLAMVGCPLWRLMLIVTFLLNYIPEVGAILSAVLTVPAVLLDGAQERNTRLWHTLWLAVLGTIIKVVTGNVIEVRLYATRGGQFMRMHPVYLMFLLMMCAELLGVSGMFLAIPIMAAVKYYMIAADMPPMLLNPTLVAIEGDLAGPHRNFVDRCRGQREEIREVARDTARMYSGATQLPLLTIAPSE